MKKFKPKIYKEHKKLIFDRTDKRKYLIQYRILKFYVRHGMVIDNVHEVGFFKQSKWLEKYIGFKTRKRNKAKNIFEKVFTN